MKLSDLPCDLAAGAEGALERCRRHVAATGCEACRRVLQEVLGLGPADMGRRGGAAGRGRAKARAHATPEHMRGLAARRWRKGDR